MPEELKPELLEHIRSGKLTQKDIADLIQMLQKTEEGPKQEEEETPKIDYPITFSLKLDVDTAMELDNIALYERKKKAALVRDQLVDMVQRYRRNPQYKLFLRKLHETEMKKRQKEGMLPSWLKGDEKK
jgi:hypothetical protein